MHIPTCETNQLALVEFASALEQANQPHPDYDMIDWVLGVMSSEDIKHIASNHPYAYDGLLKLLDGDVDGAMQICNGVK